MGCAGARRGAFFCALTAAMGGKGKAAGALPGAFAAGRGIGGTKGACFGACTMGGKGPLPIGGTVGRVNDGAADAAGGGIIGGAGGGANVGEGSAGREACSFAAGIAGTVDCGIDAGDALCAAAAARGFKQAVMLSMVQRSLGSGSSAWRAISRNGCARDSAAN